MATTSPDGISYPTNADAQKTIEQRFQDTATSVQAAFSTRPLSHNYVLNGAFDINQRNMSAANISSDQYTLDRWYLSLYGAGQPVQITKETDGGSSVPQGQYLRLRLASNTNTNFFLSQSFDNNELRQFRGKTVTLSFYYSSSISNTIVAEARWGTFTNEKFIYTGNGTAVASVSCPSSAGWVRKSTTFTVPANAEGFCIMFSATNITNGLAAVFQLSGVQLEDGSSVTSFRRNAPSVQAELASCQRYYYRTSGLGGGPYAVLAPAIANSTTQAYSVVMLPVPMRYAPTTIDYANIAICSYGLPHTAITGVAYDSNVVSPQSMGATFTFSSYSVARSDALVVLGNNNTNAYLGFSAEL